MKIIIFLLCMLPFKFFGQCFTFNLNIIPPSCLGCCDGILSINNLSGGCPPYEYILYQYYPNEPVPPEGICFDSTYTLIISDAGSCCPDTIVFCRINSITGIVKSKVKKFAFDISPIPAIDKITILFSDDFVKEAEISFINTLGELVLFNKNKVESVSEFDISYLKKGIYFIRVLIDNKYYVKKFIKY